MKRSRLTFCLFPLIVVVAFGTGNAQVNWERLNDGVLNGLPISGLYSEGMNWTKPVIVDIEGKDKTPGGASRTRTNKLTGLESTTTSTLALGANTTITVNSVGDGDTLSCPEIG